jgi:hypothetical protein
MPVTQYMCFGVFIAACPLQMPAALALCADDSEVLYCHADESTSKLKVLLQLQVQAAQQPTFSVECSFMTCLSVRCHLAVHTTPE